MSDTDVSVSNGTCYYGAGELSSENIIPCGNAASGNYACCQATDYCLEYGACWNYTYDTTYVAGCTDSKFTDPNCPRKDTSNQQILGLVQCKDSADASGSVVWSGCPGPTSKTALGIPGQCSCSGTPAGALIIWPSSLAGVASLPSAIGETILLISSSKTVSTSMSASPASLATITSAPTSSVSSSTPTVSSSEGLSIAAKAGIGIGTTSLALIVITLAIIFFLWRRRTRKERLTAGGEHNSNAHGAISPDPYEMASTDCDGLTDQPRASNSGYDGSSSTWSAGFKTELAATTKNFSYNPAELAADGVYGNVVSVEVSGTPIEPLKPPQYQVIRAVRPMSPVSTSGSGATPDVLASGTMTMSDISSQSTTSPPSQAGGWEPERAVPHLRDTGGAINVVTLDTEGHADGEGGEKEQEASETHIDEGTQS